MLHSRCYQRLFVKSNYSRWQYILRNEISVETACGRLTSFTSRAIRSVCNCFQSVSDIRYVLSASIATDQLQEIHVSLLSKSVLSVVWGSSCNLCKKKTCLKHTNLQVSLCWKLQIGDRKCLSKRPGSVVNKTRVYQHRDNTKTLRVWDQVETEKGRDSRDFESRNQHDHLYSTRVIHFFCVFWFSEWLLSSSKNILKYRILQLLSSLQLRSRLFLKNKILRFSPIESKNAIESTIRPRPSKSRTTLPLRASWTISTLIDSETLLNSGLLSVKKKLLPSG